MKKILALLAVVLGVVSCQTEPEGLDVNVGGEQEVAVCVSLPEATRSNSALGAFDNVDLSGDATIRYILQIFDQNDRPSDAEYVKYSDDKSVVFPVRLVPGRDYRFVVWADYVDSEDAGDKHYNTRNAEGKIDLTNITLNDTWVAMDETRDAFTGYYDTADNNVKYSSTLPINITLKRPFAKLRVITTDMVELRNLGIEPPFYAEVEYATEYRAGFNAFTSEAVEAVKDVKKTHAVFEIANYDDNTDANKVLFTDYFFAKNEVVKFTLNVYEGVNANGEGTGLIKSNNFNTDIFVQRNYLTTVQGNILTDGNNVTVKVEDVFAGKENWPDNNAEKLAYAAMFGGEVTLTEDVVLTQPLTIVEGANVVINLNGNTITTTEEQAGRHHYAILNNGTLSLEGNGAINARGIKNFGIMTVDGNLTITNLDSNGGAAIWNEGEVTINNGKFVSSYGAGEGSYGAALNTRAGGKAVVNGGTFEAYSQLTYAIINEGETTINNADVKGKHGAVAGAETGDKTTIKGGTFALFENPGLSDHCAYYVSAIEGGKFTLGNNTDCGAQVFYASTIAAGYKAVEAGGLYYVLPEIIANAAEAAGVNAVTESTADVATALANNNGEVALYMWNDVAYIAKYGEVIITSAADEATTVRGVVEYSTGLTSATVADGIEVVGNRTFRKCANLKTVALPRTLTEIGPAVFQSCSKLANITIPESVTTIGEQAFAECSSLESINIPAGVTRIESDALRATGLKSVEFHAGVTYFGAQAFRDCKQLTEVVINAPEFTMEGNTFGVMAAPYPTMKIYVVNAEMKAYVESKLTAHAKTYITVVAPEVVDNTADLQAALANDNKIVTVSAGEYTFPSSSVKAGQTIICKEGTVFTGTSGLNINGATVIGAEFKNEGGNAVSGTINGTFKNCNFTGNNALRSCYAGETVVFENCVFSGNSYGVHIDSGANDATFKNCVFSGFNAFGAQLTQLTLDGCTFKSNGKSGYNGANLWGSTTLKNCEFTFDGSATTEWIDCIKADGQYSFNNCTVNGAAYTSDNYTSYLEYIWSRNDTMTVKINGVDCGL